MCSSRRSRTSTSGCGTPRQSDSIRSVETAPLTQAALIDSPCAQAMDRVAQQVSPRLQVRLAAAPIEPTLTLGMKEGMGCASTARRYGCFLSRWQVLADPEPTSAVLISPPRSCR